MAKYRKVGGKLLLVGGKATTGRCCCPTFNCPCTGFETPTTLYLTISEFTVISGFCHADCGDLDFAVSGVPWGPGSNLTTMVFNATCGTQPCPGGECSSNLFVDCIGNSTYQVSDAGNFPVNIRSNCAAARNCVGIFGVFGGSLITVGRPSSCDPFYVSGIVHVSLRLTPLSSECAVATMRVTITE